MSNSSSSATTAMAPPPPPPPPPPLPPQTESEQQQQDTTTTPMGPPSMKLTPSLLPPPAPATSNKEATTDSTNESPSSSSNTNTITSKRSASTPVPYTIPEWSEPPVHQFYLEVLKDGAIVEKLDVFEKGAYMFGRVDLCDFILEHPTISRFHAVIQFKRRGDAYLYDLGSTHGTSINKKLVEKRVYVDLHVGDIIRFGQSTRMYIFQGPTELMPPETDLKTVKKVKMRQQWLDREASLKRARAEASLADGISWGLGEDAIEEAEDDADEITWQTYKGLLTEKQEKTREKISHMKKEIDAIRAKDIAQGGLTQGQQTQIARNEQRISQIMEELENLEETLNDSIRESLGARTGRSTFGHRKKGAVEDEEDFSSDEDDFYDRTKKKSSIPKAGENQSVETADSLLDKRDAILKEMEDKKELFLADKEKIELDSSAVESEAGDALDSYMSGLSSQLVIDKTLKLEEELSTLQTELDRILYLLKIADPAGEAAKKRDSKIQEPKPNTSEVHIVTSKKQPHVEKKKGKLDLPVNISKGKELILEATQDSSKIPENDKIAENPKEKKTVYNPVKPQWLGAVNNEKKEIEQKGADSSNSHDQGADEFVDYKDRKKVLADAELDLSIEAAGPGLILRKRKVDDKASEQSTSSADTELAAQDAVALLLKHKRGYHGDEEKNEKKEENQLRKDKKKAKRLLGPDKPLFLDSDPDHQTWVPPEGQSGDGRTSLNDRYGY
ncbi:hypothetical protein ACFE04_007334 [Oxalis oulophora]